jgi:DNA processing protein
LGNAINSIAMVGSRNATDYGLATTNRLSRDLATLGITIVSGMAKGIDTAAHEGALMAKGKTIAVLGSGIGRIYPADNENLFHRIVETGAVISEFPFYAEPEAHHFPMRNRIISGMSLGTVIVEATLRSGSLITARLAAEQNREVFAVPGNIHSFKSTGTHTLIKQGAKLVENSKDIIEEIPLATHVSSQESEWDGQRVDGLPTMSSAERHVLESLDHYPAHIDDIAHKLGRETGELLGLLLQLELKGMVKQSSGKFFCINPIKRGNH